MLAASCEKELDPIIKVNPLPDADAPTIAINYPIQGKPFISPDPAAVLTIKVLAVDDVELGSVVLTMNDTEILRQTSFKDYRRLDLNYNYANVVDGDYTLKATVTDLTGKSATTEVTFTKITAPVYDPMDGEVLYFPLDGYYLDLISGDELAVVGAPSFVAGKVNDCYAGAPDAYMTYSSTLVKNQEFSVAFWYKINADPQRGGIMSIGPESDDRTVGFRMFHENSGNMQNIGLNFGIGTMEVWLNPFVQVATDNDWIHIAVSISKTHATVYVNGEVAPGTSEVDIEAPIDWTGCTDQMSIASGAPNFVYWEHFSDNSLYDEIHFFKKAITADEVLHLYSVK